MASQATPNAAATAIARTVRYEGPNSPKLPDLRRELATAKIAAYVTSVVAAAPPLTDEQVDRLTALFRPTTPDGP